MIAIYKICSIVKPGLIYIGSAINFKNRKSGHLKDLKKGIHKNSKLQNHYNKYGIDDFYFEIIEELNIKELTLKREQFYIDKLKPFFNICPIAGSMLGFKHTKESILKISLSKTGLKHRPECNDEKSKRQTGQKRNGIKHSEEAKRKISLNNAKKRSVNQLSKDGKFIKSFETIRKAAKELGLNENQISIVLSGKLKTTGGFKWEYNQILQRNL